MLKEQEKKPVEETENNKRSYSESELEERIREEREKWESLNAERERSERLAALPDNERAKAEFDENVRAFEDEKKRYMQERMEFETAKLLADEGLPVSFAHLLAGGDIKESRSNVSLFKEEFTKELEANLNSRLRGRTPMTNSVVESSDPFLAGFGN